MITEDGGKKRSGDCEGEARAQGIMSIIKRDKGNQGRCVDGMEGSPGNKKKREAG